MPAIQEQPETGMTLAELVHHHKGRSTYRDLETRSGGTVSESRWAQLANPAKPTVPGVPVIQGMALALRVTQQTVWDAVGRSIGLDLRPPKSQSELYLRLAGAETEVLYDHQVDLYVELIADGVEGAKLRRDRESAAGAGTVRTLRSAARKRGGSEGRRKP